MTSRVTRSAPEKKKEPGMILGTIWLLAVPLAIIALWFLTRMWP